MVRISKIWLMPISDFRKLINDSRSITEALRNIGMQEGSANRKTLNARIKYERIDVSHMRFIVRDRKKIPLEKILVQDSTYCRGALKKRIIKNKLIEYKCDICGNNGEWMGNELTLRLDHKNGIRNDHRLENLRFLCPNCDSQTEYYCGRNVKRAHIKRVHTKKSVPCPSCDGLKIKYSKICIKCHNKLNGIKQRRAKRSNRDILINEIKKMGYCAVGRKYGVSDNAIRKWIK